MRHLLVAVISTFFFSCSTSTLTSIAISKKLPTKDDDILKTVPHTNYKIKKEPRRYPESIIFIIADGTGVGQYTLSYYANGDFAPARFDHVGLVSTHPNDGECATSCKRVTDSAASGTALSAGEKTYNGAIAVDSDLNPVKTMLEWAKDKGMSTGLVATSSVTHATPASFAAHIDYRKKEHEIAQQYATADVDVILGGGKKFWPDSLISFYESRGAQFIEDIDDTIDGDKRLLGLFHEKGLNEVYKGREVSTTQMARLALSKLEQNSRGFFVMIEESQVDWGGHANNGEYIRGEMQSLNDLINYILDYQEQNPEVLVVLTADHECGGVAVHDTDDGELDIRYTSGYHSANFVPIFATGPGASVFDAFIDNTEIGKQLIKYINEKE